MRNDGQPETAENASEPRRQVAAGCNLFLLAVLALLIAALVIWAYLRNPPSTPAPQGTGVPERAPG